MAAGRPDWAALVPAVCVLLCLGLAAVQLWQLRQTAQLSELVQLQQRRLDTLERRDTVERLDSRRLKTLHLGRSGPRLLNTVARSDPRSLYASLGRERRRRSVDSAPRQLSPAGIAIVDRPYGHRPGLHEERLGMRVYDTFGTPTEAPDSRTILPHHRSSAAYHGGPLGRVNRAPEPSGAAAALHHRRSRVHRARRGRHRRLSRRKRVHAKRKGAKQVKVAMMRGRQEVEARRSPTSFAAGSPNIPGSRHRPLPTSPWSDPGSADQLTGSSAQLAGSPAQWPASPGPGPAERLPSAGGDSSRRQGGSGSPQRLRRWLRRHLKEDLRKEFGVTAAHVESDTSGYSRRNNRHYAGNGILKNTHRSRLFTDWKFASWMERGFNEDFELLDGQVTVKKSGLYYLYAQINYHNPGDVNGFEMMIYQPSREPFAFAKCVTTESTNTDLKVNTCHTSGVTYLDKGDAVAIHDMDHGRVSMLLPDRSFFGLVRLAGVGRSSPGGYLGRR